MRYTDRIVSDFLKFGDILIHMMELSMKAKKTFLVVILCVVGFSSFAGEFFGSFFFLGNIDDNFVRFYDQVNSSWIHMSDDDLALPSGSKSVFGVGTWVGVVIGNTVQFYDQINGSWIHMSDDDLIL